MLRKNNNAWHFFDVFFKEWLSDILRRVCLRYDIGMSSGL